MSETLPLFPLGTVLYPGLLLPLNIFEERYRQLVRDLLDGPEPREFGVIAIRKGRETGVDGISALHEIGCTATLREVAEQEDGRFHLVTVGTQRFRLASLDSASQPYLQGEVEFLTEEIGDEAAAGLAAKAVQRGFRGYVEALASQESVEVNVPELPDEPLLLSYLVAASMILDLPVPAGPAGGAGRGAAARRRAGPAGPGDHDAALAHRHACPGPAEHALQPELSP